jgi:hypothetical protein
MMRIIFVSEQKRWEAAQARTAASIPTIYEDEELDFEGPDGPDLPIDESPYMGPDRTYRSCRCILVGFQFNDIWTL